MPTVLLAGGAGYIGSHTAVELLNSGYDVVVADNYYNSSPEAIRRVEKITGKNVKLYELGKVYLPHAVPVTELPDEKERLVLGMYGRLTMNLCE